MLIPRKEMNFHIFETNSTKLITIPFLKKNMILKFAYFI